MEQNSTPEVTSFERIGNNVKVVVRPAGSPDPSATPAPAAPLHKTGGITHRYNAATGELSTSRPKTVTVTAPAAKAYALDAQGSPTDLSEANERSIVTIPGMGDSPVSTWMRMGLLKRSANGRGFELAGEAASAAAATEAQPKQEQKVEQPATAADLANVQGTSEADEAVLRDVQEGAPAQFERMIEQAARGHQIDFDGIARDMGVEGGAGVEAMVSAHREAGVQVLRNLGVDPLAFERHLMGNPDLASTIIRSTLKKDMAPLVKAARAYSAERAEKVARIATSKNVPARVVGRVVMFDRASLGLPAVSGKGDFATREISEAEARRLGVLEIAE